MLCDLMAGTKKQCETWHILTWQAITCWCFANHQNEAVFLALLGNIGGSLTIGPSYGEAFPLWREEKCLQFRQHTRWAAEILQSLKIMSNFIMLVKSSSIVNFVACWTAIESVHNKACFATTTKSMSSPAVQHLCELLHIMKNFELLIMSNKQPLSFL